MWSVEDGAASSSCFAALEDAAVAAGGTTSEPWSLQIAVQRAESSKGSSELLERRTGDASKDLHVVSSYTADPSQLILVHRYAQKTSLIQQRGFFYQYQYIFLSLYTYFNLLSSSILTVEIIKLSSRQKPEQNLY